MNSKVNRLFYPKNVETLKPVKVGQFTKIIYPGRFPPRQASPLCLQRQKSSIIYPSSRFSAALIIMILTIHFMHLSILFVTLHLSPPLGFKFLMSPALPFVLVVAIASSRIAGSPPPHALAHF